MGHHLRLRGHPDQIQPRKPDIPGSSVGTPKPCGRATGGNPALALFRSHLSAIERAGEVATHLPQFYATVVDHHLTARRAPAPEGCGSGSRGSGPAGRDGTRKVALIPKQSLTAPGTWAVSDGFGPRSSRVVAALRAPQSGTSSRKGARATASRKMAAQISQTIAISIIEQAPPWPTPKRKASGAAPMRAPPSQLPQAHSAR